MQSAEVQATGSPLGRPLAWLCMWGGARVPRVKWMWNIGSGFRVPELGRLAQVELLEVVDFFLKPERFRRSGARVPKGVLLCGPPGTGAPILYPSFDKRPVLSRPGDVLDVRASCGSEQELI